MPLHGQDLDRIFAVQHERPMARDQTVPVGDRTWQIERTPWRTTLADGGVSLCEPVDGTVSIPYRPALCGPGPVAPGCEERARPAL